MRLLIFAEAIRIQAYLIERGTWNNKVIFDFKFPNGAEITTELIIENNKTLLECTCKHGSVCFEALCSHKLAIMFYLFKKQMRRLRKRW